MGCGAKGYNENAPHRIGIDQKDISHFRFGPIFQTGCGCGVEQYDRQSFRTRIGYNQVGLIIGSILIFKVSTKSGSSITVLSRSKFISVLPNLILTLVVV